MYGVNNILSITDSHSADGRCSRKFLIGGGSVDRENRIKLYKKIGSKYQYKFHELPHDEMHEALEEKHLLRGHEEFASHNEAIKVAKERAAKIDKIAIADVFLYSLSTNFCEYRSPLLSYYYIQSVVPHEIDDKDERFIDKNQRHRYCEICLYDNKKAECADLLDENNHNFRSANMALIRKYLWGSVCWWAYYFDACVLDITQYLEMPKVESSARDIEILIDALKLVETLNPSDKANSYVEKLHKFKLIPKSTKIQISTFVDTLGSLNILHKAGDYAITKGKDKYDASYKDPVEHKNDRPFPLTHWRASDGVDWDEVRLIFGITQP